MSSADILSLILSFSALVISFLAYRHSRDNFRLSLLDKRWEIYENILEFCSGVSRFGGIPSSQDIKDEQKEEIIKFLQSAEGAFRGKGYHKSRALFGPEIQKKLDELNKAYAFLRSNSKDFDKENEYLLFIWSVIKELPDIFRPYVYFGDSKK